MASSVNRRTTSGGSVFLLPRRYNRLTASEVPPIGENVHELAARRCGADRCGLLCVSRPPDLAQLDRSEGRLYGLFLQELRLRRPTEGQAAAVPLIPSDQLTLRRRPG